MRHPVIEEDLHNIVSHPLPWDRFARKTVLVTGAGGFLPAYMVETLLFLNELMPGQQTRVVALVRDLARAKARLAAYEGRQDLVFLVQDVNTPIEYPSHIDIIIHAASQASPKYYSTDPVGTLLPNVQGTGNILTLAKEHRSESVLFFSSSEIYGQMGHSSSPIRERDYGVLDPSELRSCYAESKRMGESMCAAWHAQHGVPAKIVRPFHTYGPGMRLDDGRVFADFTADIVHNRNICLKSMGEAERAFCYLADATKAFFTVLLNGAPAEAYNVGNDQAVVSIRNLAEILVGLFPEKGLSVVMQARDSDSGYIPSAVMRNRPDISRLRTLGWAPETSISDGFARTIRSYQ